MPFPKHPDPPGIRGTFLVPNWLSNRPGLNVGFRILWVIALMCDFLVQIALEGYRAALPGLGTDTALPLLGIARGLVQGRNESNSAFAERLQNYLTAWDNAGSDEALAEQIQTYLGNNLTIRIVDRAGNFTTLNPDGTFSYATSTGWNWDSVSNPERANWWSDIWIIITTSPYSTYSSLTDPAWTAAWGNYTTGLGTGHQVGRADVDAILSIVAAWKGAHAFVQAIIWNDAITLFNPASLGTSGNPNGEWGNWGYQSSPTATRTAIRTQSVLGATIRYWTPADGA